MTQMITTWMKRLHGNQCKYIWNFDIEFANTKMTLTLFTQKKKNIYIYIYLILTKMQIAPSKFDRNPFQFNFIFIQLKFQIHSTQTFCPIQLKKKIC